MRIDKAEGRGQTDVSVKDGNAVIMRFCRRTLFVFEWIDYKTETEF